MGLILEIFKGYEVEYDAVSRILTINKPMPVATFMDLRRALELTNCVVSDIRLYGDNYSRIRGIV